LSDRVIESTDQSPNHPITQSLDIMFLLSLDTTTRVGSVALVDDDLVIAERVGDPSRAHGERLPNEILSLLEQHGRRTSDVDIFAVASGPGSFTGLRVGIATMQGFAFVHRRPVVTVSALEAAAQMAASGDPPGALVGVWTDAHRRDVFAALYRVGPQAPFDPERLAEIDGPSVADPAAVLMQWEPVLGDGPVRFVGDGAVQYAMMIRARHPRALVAAPPVLAGAIGVIAARLARAGRTIAPDDVRPLYVRRPDAEIDREKRATRAATMDANPAGK
jgi:tRNA threonylcarbamoyladenosine biosynthesis protein TsaB